MLAIHPLPGHPYHIDVEESERSPLELFEYKRKPATRGVRKFKLTDPPVLLTQEGGGEKPLNESSILAQMDYASQPDCDPIAPDSLMVFIINHAHIDPRIVPLLRLLFGQIQLMSYKKKYGKKDLIWKSVMRTILEDKALQDLISMELFRGKPLETRHFISLLKRANIGTRSISYERDSIIGSKKGKDKIFSNETNEGEVIAEITEEIKAIEQTTEETYDIELDEDTLKAFEEYRDFIDEEAPEETITSPPTKPGQFTHISANQPKPTGFYTR